MNRITTKIKYHCGNRGCNSHLKLEVELREQLEIDRVPSTQGVIDLHEQALLDAGWKYEKYVGWVCPKH